MNEKKGTVEQLLADTRGLERLDAETLLAAALDKNRAWLIAHHRDSVTANAAEQFSDWIARRRGGEPLAYILGFKEFWSLPIRVTPDTLIPRPETEQVVELALAHLPPDRDCQVLDLATGSGCIALAIAGDRPRTRVTGSDISAAAIAVAEENARDLKIRNVTFVTGSWFEPVAGRQFDVITANPPYVNPDDPCLAAPELAREPRAALTAGEDPLAAYRAIFAGAADHLLPEGVLILEHGYDQRSLLQPLMDESGLELVSAHQDLAGLPRVLMARRADPDSSQ